MQRWKEEQGKFDYAVETIRQEMSCGGGELFAARKANRVNLSKIEKLSMVYRAGEGLSLGIY